MTRTSDVTRRIVRVVAIFALTSFVPLAALTFASLFLADRAVRSEVDSGLISAATVGAAAIENEMEGLEQVVASYAVRRLLRDALAGGDSPADRDTTARILRELGEVRPGISTTFAVDPSGRVINVRPPTRELTGTNLSRRDWYRRVATTNRPYVSALYESEADGRRVVAVAAPVVAVDDATEQIATIVVEYDVTAMQRLADQIGTRHPWTLTVFDQRATALRSRPTQERPHSGVRAALRGSSGIITETGRDRDQLSAYAPVHNVGWAVTASVGEATAFAGLARLRSVVLVVAIALALVLCAGLGFVVFVLRARYRAEAELTASEHRFSELVEALPVGLFVRTADGKPYLANREAQRLLGTRDEPQPVEELVREFQLFVKGTDEVYPRERLPIFRALQGESVVVDDMEVRRGDASIPLEARGAPIKDADGNLIYAVAMFADITDRRRAQEAVERAKDDAERAREEAEHAREEAERAREDAERANRAKSEFLSRMSHELRTPLNAILGFAQLLDMEERDEEERESVQTILKGGRHLLELINELLDIARVESGELPVSLEAVDAEDAVGEAIDLVRPLAESRGVSLVCAADDDLRHYVMADRQRLKQVLLNIVSNAVKYNREGGKVRAFVSAVSPESVRISVADTGPGIPKAKLDRVFAPFDRLGAEQTNVEGTGLGLALSRSLVELMGGTIAVESTPGEGSTFWIDLPIAEGILPDLMVAPSPRAVKDDVSRPTRTVLCIEDNVSSVKLLERVLEQRPNIRMLSATQGSLGLDLARLHHPDLILLDLNLPDMHGRDVLDQLRHERMTSDIPVVVLSADATPGQIKRLLESGANDYLTKPINVQKTLEVLDEVLEHYAA